MCMEVLYLKGKSKKAKWTIGAWGFRGRSEVQPVVAMVTRKHQPAEVVAWLWKTKLSSYNWLCLVQSMTGRFREKRVARQHRNIPRAFACLLSLVCVCQKLAGVAGDVDCAAWLGPQQRQGSPLKPPEWKMSLQQTWKVQARTGWQHQE